MSRAEYEDVLDRVGGVRTSLALSHSGFDKVMARLEAILWQRVDEGLVKAPDMKLARYYWRDRLPKPGMVNTRLRWKLERFWSLLRDYAPPQNRGDDYLARIIAKASGVELAQIWDGSGERPAIIWQQVPAEAARVTIEAMKDRLKHAVAS